ncbi:MAG: flagellar M-ring protein FliF, partial [Phycisphaerales bacterium]|nr:flagellar M-ring protein FliF [Phycisphaerales bacterium]
MNNFTAKLDRLQRALAELTPARRLLAGTLCAVMIATGVWAFSRASSSSSARSAAGGEMEPVLDQAFAKADIDRIVKHLDAKSVAHKVEEGKVFVAADAKLEVLSDLFYAGILSGGGDKSSAFDALVKQMTAWDAPSKTDKMFHHYREETVERVIGTWKGVRKATVVIDPTNERHLGGETVQPAAMVDIQTSHDSSANPRQLSQAAANVLTGVIANLTRERVRVTIDGATFNSGSDNLDAGGGSSGDLLERRQKSEQQHVAKVRQLLGYIPGDVLVSVSVDIDVPIISADDAAGSAKPQAEAEVVANAVPVMTDPPKSPAPAPAPV